MHRPMLPGLLLALPAALLAQPAALQMGALYECPALQATMQVFSCAGPAATDACDVQTAPQGRGTMRGKAPRQQVNAMLAICHVQTPADAQARARGGAVAGTPAGPGGLKVGDRVRVLIQGWTPAKVLRINGNSFYVHLDNGLDVQKEWPFEVFREGKLTAADHAAGQYDSHDRVQVLVNGKWVEGEVVGQQYNNYTVKVPGYKFDFDQDTTTTTPNNIRISNTPPPAAPAKRAAGQAPKAGLAACGAKFEGRWEFSAGFGGERVVFRSGKATVGGPIGDSQNYECFTGGGQVLLFEAGSFKAERMFEINNDGTLQGEFGAYKKMGN